MRKGLHYVIDTVKIPRRLFATWAVAAPVGVLMHGCGPKSQVVKSPPPVELTDAQVRDLLAETIRSGDAASELYMQLQRQLSSGSAAGRNDASEIRSMLDEMIVLNDSEKNRAYAKKILEKW
jgi:hypothetical protein